MWILADARPFGWLCCVAVCCLLATFVAPVAVLLLSKDKDRRDAAIAVLDRHPLARVRFRRKAR
jgi:hypothetical protein